jgi:hypothetical protein
MSATSNDSANELKPRELRLDRLLGRQVLAQNNRRVGRVEEFRAEKRGTGYVVIEYVIGVAGLFERLDVGVKLLFGRRAGGYLARWDQVDISNPERPRLTCPVEELRKL